MNISAMIIPLLFIVFLLILPVILGVYVYRDANGRGMNGLLWALVAVFVPSLIGLIIYLLVRGNYSDLRCPRCDTPVRDGFVVCPKCGAKLRPICPNCSTPVEPDWRVCPRCTQPLPEKQEDIHTPVKRKDRSLWKILAMILLVPALLITASIISFSAFNSGGSTSFQEVSFDEYMLDMNAEGEAAIAAAVMDWKENLTKEANHAYALQYDYKTESATMHHLLVYVPGTGNAPEQGIGQSSNLFGTTLKLELHRTGDDGTFVNILSSTDKNVTLRIEVDGKKIPCEITQVAYNPTLFFIVPPPVD